MSTMEHVERLVHKLKERDGGRDGFVVLVGAYLGVDMKTLQGLTVREAVSRLKGLGDRGRGLARRVVSWSKTEALHPDDRLFRSKMGGDSPLHRTTIWRAIVRVLGSKRRGVAIKYLKNLHRMMVKLLWLSVPGEHTLDSGSPTSHRAEVPVEPERPPWDEVIDVNALFA